MSIYTSFIWANHSLFESVEEHQQREGYLVESQHINSSAESITKALLCYHTAEPITYNMKNPCQVHREYRQCLPFLWSVVCYVLQEFIALESEKSTTPQSLSIRTITTTTTWTINTHGRTHTHTHTLKDIRTALTTTKKQWVGVELKHKHFYRNRKVVFTKHQSLVSPPFP